MKYWKSRALIILGNFGMSFFTPLVGSSLAQSIFTNSFNFYQALVTSVIAAGIMTGLSISREIVMWGELSIGRKNK